MPVVVDSLAAGVEAVSFCTPGQKLFGEIQLFSLRRRSERREVDAVTKSCISELRSLSIAVCRFTPCALTTGNTPPSNMTCKTEMALRMCMYSDDFRHRTKADWMYICHLYASLRKLSYCIICTGFPPSILVAKPSSSFLEPQASFSYTAFDFCQRLTSLSNSFKKRPKFSASLDVHMKMSATSRSGCRVRS